MLGQMFTVLFWVTSGLFLLCFTDSSTGKCSIAAFCELCLHFHEDTIIILPAICCCIRGNMKIAGKHFLHVYCSGRVHTIPYRSRNFNCMQKCGGCS